MLELCEIKKELQAKEELVQALQSEAHKLQYVEPPRPTPILATLDHLITDSCVLSVIMLELKTSYCSCSPNYPS